CYDAGLQEDPIEGEVPTVDFARAQPPAPIMGDPSSLEKAADLLVNAEMPVIITKYTARTETGFKALIALAEKLGAAVVDLHGRQNFPTRHPLAAWGSDILTRADVVLTLDLSDIYGPITKLDRVTRRTVRITPAGSKIIDIGFRD